MWTTLALCLSVLAAGLQTSAAAPRAPAAGGQAASQTGDLTVTVSYTGKAPVNETNQIWVFLFATPTVDQNSRPIDARALAKNGGSVHFKTGGAGPLYVWVTYDEKGGYSSTAGPPPPGTPIGRYSIDKKTAAPVAIKPGTKIKIAFGDAMRWMQ